MKARYLSIVRNSLSCNKVVTILYIIRSEISIFNLRDYTCFVMYFLPEREVKKFE